MTISKEVTVGQLFQAAVFVVGFIGFVYTLRAEMDQVKTNVETNGIEHQSFVKTEEFRQMQQDVREIRNMVFDYVSKTERSSPAGGYPGQTIDRRGVVPKPQGYRYPDSTDVRGAGQAVLTGPDYSWAESDKRPGR